MKGVHVERYGDSGPPLVVLHGGPGAPGSAAPVARALADRFRVLEPWQRWSSDVPLTVDRHIEDLADVIARHVPGEKPAVVGTSWGAMLGLAFAARHPQRVSALVLVGCGTFDREARARLQETLEQRMSPELRAQLADLEARFPDAGERAAESHRLCDPIYTYCRAADAVDPVERIDPMGQFESWNDMVRLQESGVYPAAFTSITCPVLMVHGSYDPHPGSMIRASIEAYVPHLEYRELDECGHSPWLEERVRDCFLEELRGWVERNLQL